jgi:hypothetical protein
MAELFGFEFKRKEKEEAFPSFVPKESDDGAVTISAGGSYGTYVDLDGTVRTEAELVTKYREMSVQPEIDAAVDEIVNASICVDEEDILKLVLDDVDITPNVKKAIQNEFKEVLRLIDFNNHAYDIYKRWYIDGRLYYHVIIDDVNVRDGIKEVRYIDPRKIRKVKEVSKKRVKNSEATVTKTEAEYYIFNERGFNVGNKQSGPTSQTGLKIAKDAVIHVTSGLTDTYGTMVLSHLHKGIKPLNQLRTLEDATVIYRISRAPERRLWYIDVGNLPKMKAEQYVREIMTKHKNRLVYDAASGEIRDDRKFMTMLEDYWLPRREGGRGTEVTTLPAGQNLGEMDDVLYFQKKLYRSLNVPVSRIEQENTAFNIGRSSEITREEVKFGKFVSRLRRKFSGLFFKLLERQLVLKGVITIEDWNNICKDMKIDFTNDGFFTELKDNEILSSRIDIYNNIIPLIGVYYSNEWVQKNILKQTDEDIEEQRAKIIEEQEDEIFNPPMMDDGTMDPSAGGGSAQQTGGGAPVQQDDGSKKLIDAQNTYQRLINKDNKSLQDMAKLKSASQIIAKSGGGKAKQVLQKYQSGVKL